jgi:hypothetical protein
MEPADPLEEPADEPFPELTDSPDAQPKVAPRQFTLRMAFALMLLVAVLLATWPLSLILTPLVLLAMAYAQWMEGLAYRWYLLFGLAIPLFSCLALPAVDDWYRHRMHGHHLHARSINNLKQIALALHAYEADYGAFPPPYVADDQGRPMHSWRVLILPYLEQTRLYKQYRFDEPWDGPNNVKLHGRIVDAFQCPLDQAPHPHGLHATSYVAVTGRGTAWQPGRARKLSEFTDGTDDTILLVELHDSGIHWMEPRDLPAGAIDDAIHPLNGQPHETGAYAAFADTSVRSLADTLTAKEVSAMLSAAGGEAKTPP